MRAKPRVLTLFYTRQPGRRVGHNAHRQREIRDESIPPADERAGEDSAVFCGGNVLPYERHTLLNGALCREFRVSGQPEIVVCVEEGILKLLRQVSPQRGRPGAGRAVDVDEWFHVISPASRPSQRYSLCPTKAP